VVTLEWGSATTAGAVRPANEDSLLALPTLFVVADGMGGHAAGECASHLAVTEFERLGGAALTMYDILDGVRAANEAILASAREDPSRLGMGTTLVGLAIVRDGDRDGWLAFHVGDSRAYRLADGRLDQLTTDHTEVQELIEAGVVEPDQRHRHPRSHILTRALGTDPGPQADCQVVPLVPGERFLLCSDGLSTELPDDQIADLLAGDSPTEAAERLADAAVEAGGHDNVTTIVIDVVAG
jgi:PPM family protein phosphatase